MKQKNNVNTVLHFLRDLITVPKIMKEVCCLIPFWLFQRLSENFILGVYNFFPQNFAL